MKLFLRTAALAVALLLGADSDRAAGFGGPWPYKVEAGANAYFRVTKHPYGQAQAGPWYLYWPLEAHFYPQAPGAYPNWPQQMTLPPNFYPPNGHHPAPGYPQPGYPQLPAPHYPQLPAPVMPPANGGR